MVQNDLPFNFFCRNARLCIKKAAFSKKANIPADELFQLKSFLGLVTTNIKLHPHYEEKKAEKQVIELEAYTNEARRRITELEAKSKNPSPAESPHAISPKSTATTPKSYAGNKDKSPKRHNSNGSKRNSTKTRLESENSMCVNGEANAKSMNKLPHTEDSNIPIEDASSKGQRTTPNRARARQQRYRESIEKGGFNPKEKYVATSPHRQRENQTPTRVSRVLNFDQDCAGSDAVPVSRAIAVDSNGAAVKDDCKQSETHGHRSGLNQTPQKHRNISANEGKFEPKPEKTKINPETLEAEHDQSHMEQMKWVRKYDHTSNGRTSSGRDTNRNGKLESEEKEHESSKSDHKSKNVSNDNDVPTRASKDEGMPVKFRKSLNRHTSGADGASSSSYQPPTLPFTHYISKLKKLVPNDEDEAAKTPLRPLACQRDKPTNAARNEVPHGSEPNGVFSPSSSSGTFAESLTYSNPVFDCEDEIEFPEVSSIKADKNYSKAVKSHSEEMGRCEANRAHRSLERISEATEEVASTSTFGRDTRPDLSARSHTRSVDKHRGGPQGSVDVNESLEFTLAGHKFRFPKDFFHGKVQVNIEDVEGLIGNALKHPDVSNGGMYGAVYDGCTRGKHPQFVGDLADCVDVRDDGFLTGETTHLHVSDAAWMTDPSHGFGGKVSDEAIYQDMATEGRRVKKSRKEMGKPSTVKPRDSVAGEEEMKNVDRETWLRSKIMQLENDLKEQRSSSLTEMKTMKGYININVCSKLEELMGTLERMQKLLMEKENEKQSFEQGLNVKVDLCKSKCESIKEQMDCFLKEFKTSLTKEMISKASMDFQDMRDLCKGQMDAVQVGISHTINSLKSELTTSINEVRQQAELKIDRNTLENSIVKKLKSKGSVLYADRDSIDEIRSELQSVWKEIHQLSEDKLELKDKIGQLTEAVSEARESFSKEHSSIRSDNMTIKKQLQHLRKKNNKAKEETREIQREVVSAMESLQSALSHMKDDGSLVQNDTEILQRLEERFTNEKVSMASQYEKVKKEEEVLKEEVAMLKAFREEVLKHGLGSWNGEKELIMESLDRLSHFYLGALDEVREDVLQMKLTGKCWIDEMECKWEHVMQMQNQNPLSTDVSVHNIMLDSLDSRISHVEQVLEGSKEIHRAQHKVHGILANLAKDQECASEAAAKAMACADKADEMLNSISETFTEAFEKSKLNTVKLQESLESDLQTVVQACAEIKRINSEIVQEKEMAIAAVSESKRRSYEIWECLQKDMVNLRNSLFHIEKDKEAASLAANKAIETANKAEEVLEAISKKYEERLASHCEAMKEKMEELTYKGQTECQLQADMSERIQDLLKAVEKVSQKTSQLDGEHKKQGLILHDLSIQVTATSEVQVNMIHSVSEVSKKVENMETNMVTLTQDIQMVQTVTEEMEKASLRHEKAVSLVLEELEKRSNHLELPVDRESFQDNINQLDRLVLEPTEKQHLMSLYEEMSSFFNKLRQVHGQEEDTPRSETTSKEIQVAINKLETKLVGLEKMVNNMESTSCCSSRTLDSKLNIFNSQIQTAVKIAATAEGKCNALGAELVKLFRLLASSKKKRMSLTEKPGVLTPERQGSVNSPLRKCAGSSRGVPQLSSRERNLHREDINNCCSRESTIDQSVRSLEGIFKPDCQRVSCNEAYGPDTESSGNSLVVPNGAMRNSDRTFRLSNVDQQASQEAESIERRPFQSEGKMAITSVGRTRIECGRNQVHVSSNQSEQDPGNRIFVNVCHRSAIVSGNRLVMKEGTFTVKSAAC